MRKLGGAALALACAMGIACGALVGSSSSEPSTADAGSDGNSSSDGGVQPDGDASVGAEADADAGTPPTNCPAGEYMCPATKTCVAMCSACAAYPIECVACDTSQKNPIGTCQPDNANAFCLNGDYSTAYKGGPGKHCDCSNTDATNCVGQSQVCVDAGNTDFCLTCGEANSNARVCKNGLACNATNRKCQ